MSRHRAAPPPRRAAAPENRHRAGPARPRYGRIAVLGSAVAVTAVAMLGGIGVLPSVAHDAPEDSVVKDESPTAQLASNAGPQAVQDSAPVGTPEHQPSTSPTDAQSDEAEEPVEPPQDATPAVSLPVDSGEGRRVVFSEASQRVWLVADDGTVERTYLVSGSAYDNLDPGTYAVYSRSERAYGVDGSGSMRWFVRFTQGDNGGAIGFHDIPVDDGAPVQTLAQLGTPLSHGCVRQQSDDAMALWDFAPNGTAVVVV